MEKSLGAVTGQPRGDAGIAATHWLACLAAEVTASRARMPRLGGVQLQDFVEHFLLGPAQASILQQAISLRHSDLGEGACANECSEKQRVGAVLCCVQMVVEGRAALDELELLDLESEGFPIADRLRDRRRFPRSGSSALLRLVTAIISNSMSRDNALPLASSRSAVLSDMRKHGRMRC